MNGGDVKRVWKMAGSAAWPAGARWERALLLGQGPSWIL